MATAATVLDLKCSRDSNISGRKWKAQILGWRVPDAIEDDCAFLPNFNCWEMVSRDWKPDIWAVAHEVMMLCVFEML